MSRTRPHHDLAGPLVAPLRKDGLKIGLYFSLIDRSSPLHPEFIKPLGNSGYNKPVMRYWIEMDPEIRTGV